jgi:F-type H+-transporting ATPase subunit alpha
LGTELDKATQQQLDRGYRMVELLKQPQFKPLAAADQVMSIYAGSKGYFDKVPVPQVQDAETNMLQFMRETKSEIRDALINTGVLDDKTESGLKTALEEWRKEWERTHAK